MVDGRAGLLGLLGLGLALFGWNVRLVVRGLLVVKLQPVFREC